MTAAKRTFDLFWTIPGLVFLLPAFAFIAALIKLEDWGPVFFRQERVGHRGKRFLMWKFRSMVVDAERKGIALTVARDPRITRVGYWLRKLTLDELPQLINVLLGDMSLVGPRPEVPGYVEFYTAEQRAVLDLVPGMTDPASLNYLDEGKLLAQTSAPEDLYIREVMPAKIRINMEYASTATIWTDFMVIMRTLTMLRR